MRRLIMRVWIVLATVLFVLPVGARGDTPHDVAVFGDSLADGVWSGLYQEAKARPGDKVYRDSKVGTGITRPDFDDFFTGFCASLATTHATDVVVMFGANDEESLRDEDHKGYLFQSSGWTKVYEARISEIVAVSRKNGAKVYWLGLPVLRDPTRNAGALFLNGIIQQTVVAGGGVFIPLEDDFKGPDGGFATHLPDKTGDLRDVRAEDGTHFSFYGYDLIAKKVLVAIEGR